MLETCENIQNLTKVSCNKVSQHKREKKEWESHFFSSSSSLPPPHPHALLTVFASSSELWHLISSCHINFSARWPNISADCKNASLTSVPTGLDPNLTVLQPCNQSPLLPILIQELDLSSNPVNLTAVPPFPSLHSLQLNNCSLTSLPETALTHLLSLSSLSLEYNLWACLLISLAPAKDHSMPRFTDLPHLRLPQLKMLSLQVRWSNMKSIGLGQPCLNPDGWLTLGTPVSLPPGPFSLSYFKVVCRSSTNSKHSISGLSLKPCLSPPLGGFPWKETNCNLSNPLSIHSSPGGSKRFSLSTI